MTTPVYELPLSSNGYTLANTPDKLGWLIPSDPAEPLSTLRERYREHGYLWLKGILNRDDVLDLRRRYFSALADTGLIAPGTDPVDGIAGDGPVRKGTYTIHDFVRWAVFESFCLARPIWEFYEAFLGGPVYLHKRKIIRHRKPGEPGATGAHYDLIYLRGGTDNLCTSWIPLGDTPVSMGGLVYLEGSDAFGQQKEAEFSAKNMELPPEERIKAYNKNMNEGGLLSKDLPALADEAGLRWLIADYETGDMVVHSAYMIHASTMNVHPENRIRLSVDIRYQLAIDAIDQRWTNHWEADDNL
jgi:ectoine hydroxylase-related dioxygenase (phytanoyl-CoA dioxygenase family)